ncbi:hypothetical protein BJF92_19410 [Rhizobium rhizosphaerae]|uniref:DUF4112 domain-containing protein n=1 Tax=Xaviernesmea rhizosphaerae TaxID=1672749 RepID=A0A1Q9AGV4_9HYPH|nr:hypothetical protein BJF92_19410 [Xaviernesmea rhizosphaerae]
MAERTWTAGGFDRNAASDTLGVEQRLLKIRRLSSIARLMDTAVGIPGTRVRFGADSVLGLVPILGDGAGALVGLYIVNEARRLGLPSEKLARMMGNLAMDSVVGSVPLLGDLFDVYFKSHRRNVQIILDHFGVQPEELRRKR